MTARKPLTSSCRVASQPAQTTLPSADIFVGNGSNLPVGVALSGDCTLSSAGAITCTKSNGTVFGTAAFGTLGNSGSDVPQLSSGLLSSSIVPTLNQSTTGTAANLSGTPSLPNGTTATTQTTGDNTTKLATDAFVLANAVTVPLALADLAAPANAGDVVCANSTPAWSDCNQGITINAQTGTSYTVPTSASLSLVTTNNASSVSVTGPAPSAGEWHLVRAAQYRSRARDRDAC
ncbi:MAG: hypothetical protein WBD87_02975 [Candidatus Acidiferrales bacterium]